MRQRSKTAFVSRYPVGRHACFVTTPEHSRTRPAGWSISGCAKEAVISSAGKRSRSHRTWWGSLWPFFVLWKLKTRAKRQSCKDISSASSMTQAALLGSHGRLRKQTASSECNRLQLSDSAVSLQPLIFRGHGAHSQRWPIKPPPSALENCASYMATHSRFTTQQTHKSLSGLKALKSGQRTKSLFAVGRSRRSKPLFVAAASCANEQRQPLFAKSREHKKEDEHR